MESTGTNVRPFDPHGPAMLPYLVIDCRVRRPAKPPKEPESGDGQTAARSGEQAERAAV